MKRAILTFSFFTFISMAFGQEYDKVAGYLGKRFLIGGGVSLSPSRHPQIPLEASQSQGQTNQENITLNKIWRADAQYAVGTYNLLGAFVGRQRTSALFEMDRYHDLEWGESYNYDSYEHTLIGLNGGADIRDLYYGAYFKKYMFRKGSIAPVGTYFKFGAAVHNYLIDFSRIRFVTNSRVSTGNYETVEYKFEFDEGKMSRIEFLASIGKTRPITDRILLDWSMEAGIIPRKGENPASFGYSNYEGNIAAKTVLFQTKKRMYEVNYVKFSIGFSYLLF